MRIVHWVAHNGSGMYHVAETLWRSERKMGLDSHIVDVDKGVSDEWGKYGDADIHVPHTNFPQEMRKRLKRPLKMVFLSHGTPEHVFGLSMQEGKRGYGHSDPFMLWMHWMQTADAVVTFWPRHQAIMQSMCDKNTKVHLIPLGIDKEFWGAGECRGKYSGKPSVLTSENGHVIKWPYDLFIMWPWIYEQLPDACLHVHYLPLDQHRWWFPLVNRNGASFGAHLSPLRYEQSELRNVLASVDFYCGLVKYGDFNRMGLEASTAGAKLISYRGNPYADHWIHEGDQREQVKELLAVLKGERAPRQDKAVIPDDMETANAMIEIYKSVLTTDMVTVPQLPKMQQGQRDESIH